MTHRRPLMTPCHSSVGRQRPLLPPHTAHVQNYCFLPVTGAPLPDFALAFVFIGAFVDAWAVVERVLDATAVPDVDVVLELDAAGFEVAALAVPSTAVLAKPARASVATDAAAIFLAFMSLSLVRVSTGRRHCTDHA